MGWWRNQAARNVTRENARAERRQVHETIARLYYRQHERGEDHREEIAELQRRIEVLDIAVKTGQFPY